MSTHTYQNVVHNTVEIILLFIVQTTCNCCNRFDANKFSYWIFPLIVDIGKTKTVKLLTNKLAQTLYLVDDKLIFISRVLKEPKEKISYNEIKVLCFKIFN